MNKLASVLGSTYSAKRKEILIKSFELSGHTFKVKIPLVSESDAIYKRITEPEQDRIKELFNTMTESLLQYKDKEDSGMEFTEEDIQVGGHSMMEAARNKVMTEQRILEYVKLLVPEDAETNLDHITYADIEAEWPLSVQLALAEKIGEVISPTYKEARGK